MSDFERRGRHFVLLALVAGGAAGHLLVGCSGNSDDSSTGTGGAGADQGGTAGSAGGGTAGSAGSASQAGEGGDAGEGGSANGGTAGSSGSAGSSPSGGTSGAAGQTGDGGDGDGGTGGGDIDIAECRDCIAESAELGPVQAEYCDVSTECIAAQDCVLEAGCYLPIPAACYCGTDIDNCENADFVPTGACVDAIRAGAGNPADNATVLERFFDFTFPTGVAMQIVDEASRSCTPACFP